MLSEGFLQLLSYQEEKKAASTTEGRGGRTHRDAPQRLLSQSADLQTNPLGAGKRLHRLNQEELDTEVDRRDEAAPLRFMPEHSPLLTLSPDLTGSLVSCSLLYQYPDLQVADAGLIPHNPNKTPTTQRSASELSGCESHQELQYERVPSMPDQGYLVMGAGEDASLGLPGSGLGPMSNSLLNGFLEKQLEEVYMQHLTDNLARCHSHLGNSLLHGLMPPPPQPGTQGRGHDSLEASLEVDSAKDISYLSTHNLIPCSSNFSSPVLQISEARNPPPLQ